MNKTTITIPEGIKFISEWKDYEYPLGHCIVDKGVTGCGYTEYCLRNNRDLILCSPRKILLENKEEKHMREGNSNVLYLKNEIDSFGDIIAWKSKIAPHIVNCRLSHKPVKFMITYDSVGYLLDYLEEHGMIGEFSLVADEFQSIFLDSYFKANVENDFLDTIQRCKNIIYLSATPMLDKYLNKLDEFKDLDYYYIDWTKSGYVETIRIANKRTNSLPDEANKIIRNYLTGNFPVIVTEDKKIVESKEAVFYFNSVTEIIRVINKNNLQPDQVNILCSKDKKSTVEKKLKRIGHTIGKIPMENEPNKMFTFCTSTCYIGADFYSKCASTYVFADPNLQWLALDISLDLPQIAGRQRDRENPFKNNITVFYKTLRKDKLFEKKEFDLLQEERIEATKAVFNLWSKTENDRERNVLKEKIVASIEVNKYASDYACVSSKTGGIAYNKLIEVANERAWEVSQEDYKDKINVTKALENVRWAELVGAHKDQDDALVDEFLDKFFHIAKTFKTRLRLFCEFMDRHKDNLYIQKSLCFKISDPKYYNYYNYFGTKTCRAVGYGESYLYQKLINETKQDTVMIQAFNIFEIGKKYTSREIKELLNILYKKLGINKIGKATDLEEWFVIKKTQIQDPITKKRDNGFEILSKK